MSAFQFRWGWVRVLGWYAVCALATLSARAAWTGALVPAYFAPDQSADWQALANAADRVPLIAIANVFNGPGTERQQAVATVLQQVRDRGGRVVGYVHSTYGKRPLEQVRADALRWGEFYSLDGIFVDEMTNDTASTNLTYYQTLYHDLKTEHPEWLVVGNPGINTREAYLTGPSADLLVVFENRVGYLTYQRDLWTSQHPTSSFAHLGYQVPAANFPTYLGLARTRRAGWVYFTDDALPNPWDRLPTYWPALVNDLEAKNAAEPLSISLQRGENGVFRLRIRSIPGLHSVQASSDLRTWFDWVPVRVLGEEEVVELPWAPAQQRYLRVVR
ncbi:MAG: spherulation-specific family 4 protein [Verrucomicrobiales bacterium]|nr:spherulation-specific family 4 protein [Verrucomicrobiales bacterium]